jgi:hypothetical protein
MNVAFPRVNPTMQHHIAIPLTPHSEAASALYVPQDMAGVSLFETFEEEHNGDPHPATLGPRHDNTLQTTLGIILHVFSTQLHSQTPRCSMQPPSSFVFVVDLVLILVILPTTTKI